MEFFNYLINSLSSYPYLVVLLGFLAIMFLVPIPEEFVLMTGGYLSASQGGTIWLPTLLAGIFGVIITDLVPFFLAKVYGHKILKRKLISDKILRFVNKYGAFSAFLIRFVPGGLRNPTFLICGLSGVESKKFVLAVSFGALISSQFSFWLGYFFSDKIDYFLEKITIAGKGVSWTVLSVLFIYLFYKIYIKFIKGRKDEGSR